MRTVLSKLKGVKHVTVHVGRLWRKGRFTKVTAKSSTTSASTVPEVWIMLGLLLSVAMQIVYANQRDTNISGITPQGKENE